MAAATPTLSQADIQQLVQLYGGGFNADQLGLRAGLSISQLVPAYLGMQTGETDQNTIQAQDPIRDQLVAAGWLSPASDAQGNAAWGPGAMWEMANPRTGTMDVPSISTVNFGVTPGGNAFSQSRAAQSRAPSDAQSTWWNNFSAGPADPVTGLQKITGGNVGFKAGSAFDRMIGPLIGAALGAGAGSLGVFGPLGSAGSSLFNTAGNAVLGGKFNPFSLLGPLGSAAGIPSWLMPFIAQGVNVAQGGKPNPISAGLSLAQLLSRSGGS